MSISLVSNPQPNPERIKSIAFDYLASNGFHEMMANSLTNSEYYDNKENAVEILNPLSQDLDVMRQSLTYGGLEAVQYNQNRSHADLRLFEFGKTYHQYSTGNVENQEIGIYLTGKPQSENWITSNEDSQIFILKGIIEGLLSRLRAS